MSKNLNGMSICGYALLGLLCFCCGCTFGQKWSENYALLPGVTATDPAFIDNKPETIGLSHRQESPDTKGVYLDLPSEAIIYLPEKKTLYRIVIHSTNLQTFQIHAFNSRGKWDKIYDQRSNSKPTIDIRLKTAVITSGIKVVVRRTTEDAARKRQNVQLRRKNVQTSDGNIQRGRYHYFITGATTALAKISEIELYGYAPTSP